MREVRCPDCGRLLCRVAADHAGDVEIKCVKCGALIRIRNGAATVKDAARR